MPFNHFKSVEPTDQYVVRCLGFPVMGAADLADLRRILYDLRELGFVVGDQINPHAQVHQKRIPSEALVFDAGGNRRHDLESPYTQSFLGWGREMKELPWTGDIRPRGHAIPGTGKHVWCSSYRCPKTQSERRKAVRLIDEGEPPIRGPRMANQLPNRWDDIVRPYRQRCWKHYRKTRWKTKQEAV